MIISLTLKDDLGKLLAGMAGGDDVDGKCWIR